MESNMNKIEYGFGAIGNRTYVTDRASALAIINRKGGATFFLRGRSADGKRTAMSCGGGSARNEAEFDAILARDQHWIDLLKTTDSYSENQRVKHIAATEAKRRKNERPATQA
jgi:hypothetical protein